MKDLLKPTLLVLITSILAIEGFNLATWLMNQSNTIVFYSGVLLLIACLVVFFSITLENIIKVFINFKNKNKNKNESIG
jgi:hypothetical protein